MPAPKAFPAPGGGGREVWAGRHVYLLDLPPRLVPDVCPRSGSRIPHRSHIHTPSGRLQGVVFAYGPHGSTQQLWEHGPWATCPHRELAAQCSAALGIGTEPSPALGSGMSSNILLHAQKAEGARQVPTETHWGQIMLISPQKKCP